MFRVFLFITLALLSLPTLANEELSFATQEFYPFAYEIEGHPSGPAVEIVNTACELAKFDCSISILPWPRALRHVEYSVVNGIFPVGWSTARAGKLYFSRPIIDTEYGFFAADNSNFHNKEDLTGLNIGVYGPSNTSRKLIEITKDLTGVKLDITAHDEFAFKKLSVGRVDAVYSNKLVGKALIAKLRLTNINYYIRDSKLKYYIGLSKVNTLPSVAEKYMQTISYMLDKGIIEKILLKYPQLNEIK